MRAVVLERQVEDLSGAIDALVVGERPKPRPARGQVLVRVAAAPANPSDLMLLTGLYAAEKDLPAAAGFEGAGRVVESGGGLVARTLVGKRVACAGQARGDGTWAEWFVADALECVPLPDAVDDAAGASAIVNPMTALGLLDLARRGGHRALVHTAAASQVGRMLLRLGRERGVEIVHVVRRDAQVELLRGLGARHVLSTADDDFDARLADAVRSTGATLGLDAVAGETSGRVLRALPDGSALVVYGALSEEGVLLDPRDPIFRAKTVRGFHLARWMRSLSLLRAWRLTRGATRLIGDGVLATDVRAEVGFDGWKDALRAYARDMSGGKVVLRP